MNAFDIMTDYLVPGDLVKHVSGEQYTEFERMWVIYALQEKRYGQAFCEHFKLSTTSPLYYFKDEKISRRWIQDNYLK